MAENDSVETFGIIIKYGTRGSSPATVLAAANLKDVSDLPSLKGGKYDKTRVNQSSRVKQSAPTMAEPGPLKCVIGFKPADVAAVYGMILVEKSYQIEFVDGSTLDFDGWLAEINPKAKAEDEVTFELSFETTGEPTFTEPSP